jgi:hypothetical protein
MSSGKELSPEEKLLHVIQSGGIDPEPAETTSADDQVPDDLTISLDLDSDETTYEKADSQAKPPRGLPPKITPKKSPIMPSAKAPVEKAEPISSQLSLAQAQAIPAKAGSAKAVPLTAKISVAKAAPAKTVNSQVKPAIAKAVNMGKPDSMAQKPTVKVATPPAPQKEAQHIPEAPQITPTQIIRDVNSALDTEAAKPHKNLIIGQAASHDELPSDSMHTPSVMEGLTTNLRLGNLGKLLNARFINACLVFAVLVLGGLAGYRIFNVLQNPRGVPSFNGSMDSNDVWSPPDRTSSAVVYAGVKRNIFSDLSKPVVAQAAPTEAPWQTWVNKNVLVLGKQINSDPSLSEAIVRDKEAGMTYFLRAGQSFGPLFANKPLVIKEILQDKVLFVCNGEVMEK